LNARYKTEEITYFERFSPLSQKLIDYCSTGAKASMMDLLNEEVFEYSYIKL
jgi:hypothetical protein